MVAVVALGIAPAQASASPQDVAATHTYIEANYALAQASVARIGPSETKIGHLKEDLAHECPGVGVGSPENEASQPVSYAVTVALWSLAYGTDAGPISTFVNTMGTLRWSNHAITRAGQIYAKDLHELASLPVPELCANVRSWKESGFTVIPPAMVSLVRRVEALQPTAISARLLAPYERGADASILARTTHLETKIEEFEFVVGQRDWNQVLETLGLNE